MLVVIAIASLLMSVVMANINQARKKARITKVVTDVKAIEHAMIQYWNDTGDLPYHDHLWSSKCEESDFITGAFRANHLEIKGWSGPYIADWPKNPWGGDYMIQNWEGAITSPGNVALHGFSISMSGGPSGTSSEIPADEILMLDRVLDNGNPNSGVLQAIDTGPWKSHWTSDEPFKSLEYHFQDGMFPSLNNDIWGESDCP